jgi:hypothetical protein
LKSLDNSFEFGSFQSATSGHPSQPSRYMGSKKGAQKEEKGIKNGIEIGQNGTFQKGIRRGADFLTGGLEMGSVGSRMGSEIRSHEGSFIGMDPTLGRSFFSGGSMADIDTLMSDSVSLSVRKNSLSPSISSLPNTLSLPLSTPSLPLSVPLPPSLPLSIPLSDVPEELGLGAGSGLELSRGLDVEAQRREGSYEGNDNRTDAAILLMRPSLDDR